MIRTKQLLILNKPVNHKTFSSEEFKGRKIFLIGIDFEDQVGVRLKKMKVTNEEVSSMNHQMMNAYEGEK